MSHLGVDVIDFLLIAIYPAIALLVIEMICRAAKISTWIKLIAQGAMCIGFGVAYVTLITPHWFTAFVLFALALTLFYQARKSKINPEKSLY